MAPLLLKLAISLALVAATLADVLGASADFGANDAGACAVARCRTYPGRALIVSNALGRPPPFLLLLSGPELAVDLADVLSTSLTHDEASDDAGSWCWR